MAISYWCVFVAFLLPFLLSVLARSGARKQDYVADPRGFNEHLTGWRRRSHLAQLNAFEAFPPFAAAVIIAHLQSVPAGMLDGIAVLFVACRVLHGAFYLADRPRLRSVSWRAGMICVVALFVLAAVAGGRS
jgi:uncharacterized MAPEG superfamily protein